MEDPFTLDNNAILDEQAKRLFEICDSDKKGFVVRADLSKLEGLIPDVSFADLEDFFERSDHNRVNMVNEQHFTLGIKSLLLSTHHQKKNGIEKDDVPNLDRDHFKSISLDRPEDLLMQKHAAIVIDVSRPKLSISIGDEGCDGLAKISADPYCPPKSPGGTSRLHPNSGRLWHTKGSRTPDVSLHDELTVATMGERSRSQPDNVSFNMDASKSHYRPQDETQRIEWKNHIQEPRTPDRIFKVVFVGDSAVGKTCFLHRFCHNRFKPLFNATIGVDFTVKTIKVHDRLVAVQLWDTAGQERFRSITKQYFRKADGVVLMYDITSEQSFLSVRDWIESVRVGVDDGCVMCLIGNKVDLASNGQSRAVTYENGEELASEFDMLFFETSAFSGLGINDSMRAMAM
ncbi:Protein 4R79.2 b [Aphelenchoides avenae]|nr:Protein 4R79.2 b [Aphelenchus avenae]